MMKRTGAREWTVYNSAGKPVGKYPSAYLAVQRMKQVRARH